MLLYLEEDDVGFDITTQGLLRAHPKAQEEPGIALAKTQANQPGLTANQYPSCQTALIPRSACISTGHNAAETLLAEFRQYWPHHGLTLNWHVPAGARCETRSPLATLSGAMPEILAIERTLLNLLQLLCGTATRTRAFADALAATQTRIAHTRKTIPGLRAAQRQAVLDGGGQLHRGRLSEAALVKDNHWAWLAQNNVSPESGLQALRTFLPHTARLWVEVDSLAQLTNLMQNAQTQTCIDGILLDNFSPAQIQDAIALIDNRALIEVSGGIKLETIQQYALPGVHVISTSALTLGAPPIDIGMDFITP
ncbi:MAG: carboxylating nicotinate-nucleotide diphosphorylase [Vampirovibrionales bacterium]|nr:carboxylating nicotinate-nucleotide diphosphorylase [Vampirovibrionales bacterium]